MAAVNHQLFVYDNGRKIKDSNDLEMIVRALSVSADGNNNGLTITEATGKFDFNGKVLGNLGTPSANGQALVYDMLGANSGIATLDSGGKIPATQLPNSVMEFQGSWNASTNTPTLADGTGNAGDVYRASAAGTQDLGSGSQTWAIGDWVMYSGTIWERSPASDAVTSVNGQTGTVSLDTDDVSEGTNKYYTATQARSDLIETTAITDGDNTKAPSNNLVFDALALKADASSVPSSTDDLSEGTTNLYFTASRAKSAAVADSITDGVTDVAPSQNAVFDALALKADASSIGSSQFASFTNKSGIAGVAEVTDITAVADSAFSLANKYFPLQVIDGMAMPANYYIWYSSIDSGAPAEVDPAPGGTGINVQFFQNDTADTIASYTRSALTSLSGFASTGGTGAVIRITNLNTGAVTDATAGTSGFSVNVVTQGVDASTTAVTVRQFVKMAVAGEVTLLTSADSVNDESFFGCVKDASIDYDASGSVYLPEVGARVAGFSGLDVTKLVYAHASTGGSFTQTRPTTGKVIILGKPVSATEIIFLGRFEAEYV